MEQLEETLRGLAAPKDYGQVLQDVTRQVREDTRQRFLQEVDPDGNPWPDLAESTIERKRQKNMPLVKLVEHGSLWASLGSVEEITADSLEWGTVDPKAWYHDEGEGVPQRQIVGFSRADMDGIAEQTADFVEQEVARAFDAIGT